MNLIDGKAISAKCKAETAEEIKALTADGRRAPCLAVILVGDDPASAVYVKNKKRDRIYFFCLFKTPLLTEVMVAQFKATSSCIKEKRTIYRVFSF